MDLIAWLEDLAAAYRIEPSEATARRYLKSLEAWRMAPEQCEQLGDRSALRFARFPSIAELHEIAHEVKLEERWFGPADAGSGPGPDPI